MNQFPMLRYIGTKAVKAVPMTRGAYNAYRGWDVPSNENPLDDGYLVEYLDGGAANHSDHAGYISWSPKDVFERSYRTVAGLTFGTAIELLKAGQKLAREGWNGKGMFIYLVSGSRFTVNRAPLLGIYPEGTVIDYRSHIDMRTADGSCVPWVASQTDILAEDWKVVP